MRTLERVRHCGGLQRRHAAVLFVDLSGFTALVESVEPELVYERVRPLIDELVLLVHEHGGDIQQVLGDGFMAVFGLPPAYGRHGDEVGQAVRAGMALLSAGDGSRDLPVHVGIECGEVLVSPSWEPAHFGVWGRAVTVARRLCEIAGPGVLHVGQQAYELGGRQVLEGSGVGVSASLHAGLKGMAREVVVYSVTGIRPPSIRW